jgi:hypothetical protein
VVLVDVDLDPILRRISLPGGKAFTFNWGDFYKEIPWNRSQL